MPLIFISNRRELASSSASLETVTASRRHVFSLFGSSDTRCPRGSAARYPQLVERPLVVAPVLAHFHEEAQEYVAAQQLLDVGPSGGAHLFQARAAPADDDLAVRRPLDIDDEADACNRLGLFPRFGHDGGHVRKLFAGHPEQFFAHELGRYRALGLVGQGVFGKEHGAFGQVLEDLAHEQIGPVPLERGDRNDFGEFALGGISLDQREQPALVAHRIDFVQRQERGRADPLDHIEHEAVARTHRFRRVDHQEYKVDRRKRARDYGHHPAVERVARLVYPRRVDENDLSFGPRQHAADARAGRLRLIGDDGDLLADNFIEQSRLARVRAAYERYRAGLQPFRLFCFGLAAVVLPFGTRVGSLVWHPCCTDLFARGVWRRVADQARSRFFNRGNADAVHALAVGINDLESESFEFQHLARRRHMPHLADDEPGYGSEIVRLDLFIIQQLDLSDLGAAVDHVRAVLHPGDPVGDARAVLVFDLAQDLFDYILYGDEPRHASILVDHHGYLHLRLLHLFEQLPDRLALGHEVSEAK